MHHSDVCHVPMSNKNITCNTMKQQPWRWQIHFHDSVFSQLLATHYGNLLLKGDCPLLSWQFWSVSCSCSFALPESYINEISPILSSESCLIRLAKCIPKLPMCLSVSVLYSFVLMNSIPSYQYTTINSSVLGECE